MHWQVHCEHEKDRNRRKTDSQSGTRKEDQTEWNGGESRIIGLVLQVSGYRKHCGGESCGEALIHVFDIHSTYQRN